jgi:hypothetical protein
MHKTILFCFVVIGFEIKDFGLRIDFIENGRPAYPLNKVHDCQGFEHIKSPLNTLDQ